MSIFNVTVVLVVSACMLPVSSHAYLCGTVSKRGFPNIYNLSLNEHGIARGNFTSKQADHIFAQPDCQIKFAKGSTLWGREGSPGLGLGNNFPGDLEVCCTCTPQTCDMVQLGNACARLFAGDNCNTCEVEGFTVMDGENDDNLHYGTPESQENGPRTGNGILSVVVNWGCKLVLYEKSNYEGMRRIYYNGVNADRYGNGIGKGYWNPTKSYTCDCQRSPNQDVAEWITLVTGDPTGNGTSLLAANETRNGTLV